MNEQKSTRRFTQARKAQLIDWLKRYFKASDAAYQQAFQELGYDAKGYSLTLSTGPYHYWLQVTHDIDKDYSVNKKLQEHRNVLFMKDYRKLVKEFKELDFQKDEISGIISSINRRLLWWETIFDTSEPLFELSRAVICFKMLNDLYEMPNSRRVRGITISLLRRIFNPDMEE